MSSSRIGGFDTTPAEKRIALNNGTPLASSVSAVRVNCAVSNDATSARGRAYQTSEPYYAGQTPTYNVTTFDVLGRPTAVSAADPTESGTIAYDGFTVTTTDAGGRIQRVIADALGRPTRSEEKNAAGVMLAITQLTYDTAGNLWKTQKRTPGDSLIGNTLTTNVHDRLGRRTQTTDPDAGLIRYTYDSFGDLRKEQTPRLFAQSASLYRELDYDALGRLVTRRDPSTDLLTTVTSTFTYDQVPAGCEAGKGQLTSEAISGGGEPGITTTYCYAPAQFGRLASESRVTGGTTYLTSYTYDVLGRLSQVKYPVTPSYPGRYAVNYSYSPRGYLERVQEAQGSSTVLYQVIGANARGQIEKSYLGDGSRTTRGFIKDSGRLQFTNAAIGASQPVQNLVYAYDAIANLSSRADLIHSVAESFGYDALDRVTASTVTNGTGAHPTTYQYDSTGTLGNLTHKGDVSTLPSASMTYLTSGAPHALQTLNTGSATRTFDYDANGNLTGGQVDSGTRTLAWTSDDLPASVTQGTISRAFSYGPDRSRYQQVWTSGATTRTYTYIGQHYVQEVQGSSTEHKLYVFVNGEPIALHDDDGTPETRFLHKDHLGSITTTITNTNWAGREKASYDPWGRRRSGTDWWSAAASASDERGYTGHEHLDDVNLIHMNGRIYDPKLGHMLSPDPLLADPLSSQHYNRYLYVLGNPLKYTDPSGFLDLDHDAGQPGPGWRPRDPVWDDLGRVADWSGFNVPLPPPDIPGWEYNYLCACLQPRQASPDVAPPDTPPDPDEVSGFFPDDSWRV
jgi:RHS repeat-associated protein